MAGFVSGSVWKSTLPVWTPKSCKVWTPKVPKSSTESTWFKSMNLRGTLPNGEGKCWQTLRGWLNGLMTPQLPSIWYPLEGPGTWRVSWWSCHQIHFLVFRAHFSVLCVTSVPFFWTEQVRKGSFQRLLVTPNWEIKRSDWITWWRVSFWPNYNVSPTWIFLK